MMPGAPPQSTRRRSLARRSLLRVAAGGVLLAGGCGSADRTTGDPAVAPAAAVPPEPTQPPIASPVPGYLDPERWAGRAVTVASVGGEYQDAQAVAIFDPFAAATGGVVQQKAFDLGEMRQQVEQGAVTWDLTVLPTEEVLPLAREGYLTPIDYQTVDRTPLFDEIAMQHGVGAAFFSSVLAYPVGASPAPRGWADFWDVARFPGSRALRRAPVGTMEFALLADGVPRDHLYPLDVERAFASLDRIKPHVAQWFDNRNQPVALLLGGDVALTSTFSPTAETPEARAGVVLGWDDGMLSADSWAIPRGAPNADVAMDLIGFATRAVPAANFSRLVPFGPVNRDAFALLRPERLALLPNGDARRAAQFYQGWSWWSDRRDDLVRRFEEWLIADPAPTP